MGCPPQTRLARGEIRVEGEARCLTLRCAQAQNAGCGRIVTETRPATQNQHDIKCGLASPILHLDSLALHLWRNQMASDDRVRTAVAAFGKHPFGLSTHPGAWKSSAMSAALDAADAVASEWRLFEFKPETTQGWVEFYCQFESMDGNPVAPSIWLANWQDALICPSKTRQAITHWRPHVAPSGAA
jgi:hypothetical protein